MKQVLIILISAFTFASCSTKKAALDEETLPKDIALKPDNEFSQEEEQIQMKNMIREIDSLIGRENCSDITDWKYTAIGAKACGGPGSYLAYPLKLEDEILERVSRFTHKQSEFNTKYGISSDCAMVLPPSELKCENGKAVLMRASQEDLASD